MIDPRIRRRQIDVARQAGRRRLRLVVAAVVVVGVVLAAWGATRSPLFDVDRVLVDGAARSGDGAVRTAAAIPLGRAMTDVNGAAAARRVARLPWVEHADVVREWPSTVRVRVVERGAAAVVRAAPRAPGAAEQGAGADAAWVLVDRVGRVLAPVTSPPPGVVIVDGVPPAGPPGTRMAAAASGALVVAADLPVGLAPRVATVTVTATGVELRLKPQGVVRLGGSDDIAAKLEATRTVLGAVDGRTVSTLDVRIPSSPVLTRL
ncbi:MAG TPA: FtsQ-type POTRA domain-containing protein [Acidimicrobiales bacterium]|nr:FtsQ-type POTRA domain-containing protein [Acidimicrobiales bacterium]